MTCAPISESFSPRVLCRGPAAPRAPRARDPSGARPAVTSSPPAATSPTARTQRPRCVNDNSLFGGFPSKAKIPTFQVVGENSEFFFFYISAVLNFHTYVSLSHFCRPTPPYPRTGARCPKAAPARWRPASSASSASAHGAAAVPSSRSLGFCFLGSGNLLPPLPRRWVLGI